MVKEYEMIDQADYIGLKDSIMAIVDRMHEGQEGPLKTSKIIPVVLREMGEAAIDASREGTHYGHQIEVLASIGWTVEWIRETLENAKPA